MFSGEFAKVFETKVWRVQVAFNWCFQLSQILTKISVVIFDIVVKKEIRSSWGNRMLFSVVLVKFHLFGINWPVFMQKLSFVYHHYSENGPRSRIWKVLPNMVFPDLGEKMAAFWACACKLSWTLFSPARVQPLYRAGRKESSGTGLHPPCHIKWTFH